jgi:hypothetical protein
MVVDMTERGEDWASELWPDDYWPDYEPTALNKGTGAPRLSAPRRRRLLGLMMTAAVAIAAGAGGALAAKDLTSSASPAASAAQSGTGSSGRSGTGGSPAERASASIVIGGQVTAVSRRSITIGAWPQAVTAKVTGSSRFSGRVTSIAGVRVGDEVMAEISQADGVYSLVALQDPVSVS